MRLALKSLPDSLLHIQPLVILRNAAIAPAVTIEPNGKTQAAPTKYTAPTNAPCRHGWANAH